MIDSFDIERAKYRELWDECSRAFNPAGIYACNFGASGQRGVYPDYSLAKNGSINDGTAHGSNVFVRPSIYQGMVCTHHIGTSANDHITFPDTALPSGAQNVSISIWFNATTYDTGSGVSVIITYGNTLAGGGGSFYKSVQIYLAVGGLYCGTYGSDIGPVPWSEFTGKWTHVAYTKAGNSVRIYINGRLYTSGTLGGAANVTLWGNGYIGANNDIGMKYPYFGYVGTSSIYSRIISDEEIRLLSSDQQIMWEEEAIALYLTASTGNRRRRVLMTQ